MSDASASSSAPDYHTNPNVEEGSISPIERRDSLEKHLQHRPAPQDLKEKHILLDTAAAPLVVLGPLKEHDVVWVRETTLTARQNRVHSSLQAAQHDLARQKASDNLKKHLEKRPERENLVER